LSETYGIFVYQEQVMQAAQVLAGYSLGGADLLRRAMGKKIKAEMDAQRATFVEGCAKANGIPAAQANSLFDLIDKFAGYGFNKSHAAAYALLTYQTAWLKAHHPHEFYAASMCFDLGQTDKLCVFADDMRRLGVACLPPSIAESAADFTVEAHGGGLAVRYALGALRGVGERAMADLVADRDARGPFRSIEDFADRIDARTLNRRQLESLAAAGAFEPLMPERARVHAGAETILAHAASAEAARTSGQGGLFGGESGGVPPIRLAETHWSLADTMAAEKEAFGFYFSAHPTDRYRHIAQAHGARSWGEWCAQPLPAAPPPDERGRRQPAPTAAMTALVEEARWRTSARGRRYLLATCSDASGQYMASCFDDEVSAKLEEAARVGGCGLLTVELDRRGDDEQPRVTVRAVRPLEGLTMATRLRLDVAIDEASAVHALAAMLAGARGGRGELHLHAASGAAVLAGRDFMFDAELVARVERLPGVTFTRLAPLVALALVG
jgi:DNA polymerase-3 subunit alpha